MRLMTLNRRSFLGGSLAAASCPGAVPGADAPNRNLRADVCVVGGGLTGALCALAAAQSGLETVLITAGCAGFGGTAYSSARRCRSGISRTQGPHQ